MFEDGKILRKCMFIDIGFQDDEVAKSGAYTDALGEELLVMYSSCGYVIAVVDFSLNVQKRHAPFMFLWSENICFDLFYQSDLERACSSRPSCLMSTPPPPETYTGWPKMTERNQEGMT